MADLATVMARGQQEQSNLGRTLSAQGATLQDTTTGMINDQMKLRAMQQEQQSRVDQMGNAIMDVYIQRQKKSSAAKKAVEDILAQMPAKPNEAVFEFDQNDPTKVISRTEVDNIPNRAQLEADLEKAMTAKRNSDNERNAYVMDIVRNPSLVNILNNMSMADEDIMNTMFNEEVYESLSQPEKDEWGARWTMYRMLEQQQQEAERETALDLEREKQDIIADARIKVDQAAADAKLPGQLAAAGAKADEEAAKQKATEELATLQNTADSLLGGLNVFQSDKKTSKAFSGMMAGLTDMRTAVKAAYDADPEKTMVANEYTMDVMAPLYGDDKSATVDGEEFDLTSMKGIREYLTTAYNAASDTLYSEGSPYGDYLQLLLQATNEDVSTAPWREAKTFRERLRVKQTKAELKPRTTAEGM